MSRNMQVQDKQNLYENGYRVNMSDKNSDQLHLQSEELKKKYRLKHLKIAMIGVVCILVAVIIIVLIGSKSSWWSSTNNENPTVSQSVTTLLASGAKLVKSLFKSSSE